MSRDAGFPVHGAVPLDFGELSRAVVAFRGFVARDVALAFGFASLLLISGPSGCGVGLP